ncbi:Protein of unknown function, partial [Cotesia congregata]
ARISLSDPALAYQSIGPGSSPAYTNEYFQYLSVLFCSAQEIQTSSNLKSLPPTVVAHDLRRALAYRIRPLLTKALDRVRVRLYYSAQPKKYKRVPISKVYPLPSDKCRNEKLTGTVEL